MKSLGIPVVVASLVGLCLLAGPAVPSAQADFVFGTPVNLRSVIPVLDPYYDSVDCFSYDGLEMYIESTRSPGYGSYDLWVLRRSSSNPEWSAPENLGPAMNWPAGDGGATISSDGLTLYLHSARGGSLGNGDLWMTTRATKESPWVPPANMGPPINAASDDGAPWISPDGLELYYSSNRGDGLGGYDLWVMTRATERDKWGAPVNLGPTVNSSSGELWESLSPDGLVLLFNSNRPDGYGGHDLYVAKRATTKSPWGPPTNLGPVINTPDGEQSPRISPDGRTLYFGTWYPSSNSWENWQAPIIPVADFNGDGKVDAADMVLLSDNWGQDNAVCDIGPFAWGDGVVDEKDLKVFLEAAIAPAPRATEVPADAVLSWLAPSFAPVCDIYLGTVPAFLSIASRTAPLGVLVARDQTATTYDPPGLLKNSQTYYWRVDFVIPGPTPTIYKGAVWEFKTEAYARPIRDVLAKASSSQLGSGPEKTVDGSGLGKNDAHSTNVKEMWQSGMTGPHWIQYEFDKVYTVRELWVWNSNQMVEPIIGFGAKTVKIEYSTDGTTWTTLADVPEFARATGKPDYTANIKVNFGDVLAKCVKLTIEKTWGITPQTGLSEVRFICIPIPAAPKP
jgi:hypothetical protein